MNVTALLAMRKLSSNPSRIELMNKRVAPRLPPHLVSRWQQIVPLIEECARERNTVVHGDWWLSDLYPDGLILQDKQWQLTLYEVQCFEYVLECISTLSTALVKFAREVGKAQIG
ncbi:hypothetical protein [Mesorhizobium denitrificans]|uniref:hypothetical protein n=1 Tax=Mesorhizobium denitrificans TaxID=2294114 RepID=UPI0011C02E48|nr:hypothetical protein [Mesorhizobium denitrificans]